MMHDLAKEAWLKALRSGEFKQTAGQLAASYEKHGELNYCCLGVLCEVAVRNGANVEKVSKDGYNISYDNRTDVLPESVMAWAGLDHAEPFVEYQSDKIPITVLNDDYELTFEEIADLVEEQL